MDGEHVRPGDRVSLRDFRGWLRPCVVVSVNGGRMVARTEATTHGVTFVGVPVSKIEKGATNGR